MPFEQLDQFSLPEVTFPLSIRVAAVNKTGWETGRVEPKNLGFRNPKADSADRATSILSGLLVSVMQLESEIVSRYITERDPRRTYPLKPSSSRDLALESQFGCLNKLANFLLASLQPEAPRNPKIGLGWKNPIVELIKYDGIKLEKPTLNNPLNYLCKDMDCPPALLKFGFEDDQTGESIELRLFPQVFSHFPGYHHLEGATAEQAAYSIHRLSRGKDLQHGHEVFAKSKLVKPHMRVIYSVDGTELATLTGDVQTEIRHGKQIDGIDLMWQAQPETRVFLPLGLTDGKPQPLERFAQDLLIQTFS